MTIGYARVSSNEQDNKKFHADLLQNGAKSIVEEKVTGKRSWRKRKLADLLEQLQDGDTILTPEFTRLGRDMADLLDFVQHAREKGVTTIILKDDYIIKPVGNAMSDLLMKIMASMAQFERERLSERTKEGLAYAKAQGKQLGGYRAAGSHGEGYREHPLKQTILESLETGSTVSRLSKKHGVSRNSIYRWKKTM